MLRGKRLLNVGGKRGCVKRYLSRGDIVLRKRLGQHILRDPRISHAIARSAQVEPHEHVLEIGPGTGNLTVPLLERCESVTAIELDEALARQCEGRVGKLGMRDRLKLVRGDALRVEWPRFDALVANIPYQITSPLLERLLVDHTQPPPAPRVAVMLIQQEVAERLTASPGSRFYSRLSVFAHLCCSSVEKVMHVPASAFIPPPKVESAVVRLSLGWAEEEDGGGGVFGARFVNSGGIGGNMRRIVTSTEAIPVGYGGGSGERVVKVDGDRVVVDIPTLGLANVLKACFGGKNKTFRSRWTSNRATLQSLATHTTNPAFHNNPQAIRATIDSQLAENGLSSVRPNACPPALFLKLYLLLDSMGFTLQTPP